MKQLLGKTTKGILFTLVLLLSLSIGMITAKEAAAMAIAPPSVTGILTRVDKEQEQLFVKQDKGAAEVMLQWNKDSAFVLDNKAVLADAFTKKALGKRVEISYQPGGENKKVILSARILP